MPKKLYVLAGTAGEAAHFARAHDIPMSSIAYVSQSFSVRGTHDPAFVVVGSFWKRRDADEVWKDLQMCFAGSDIEPTYPVRMIAPPPTMTKTPAKKRISREPDEDDWSFTPTPDDPVVNGKKTFRKIQ